MTPGAGAVSRLLADPPALHGETTYSLVGDVLEWIGRLPGDLRTLETGCGLSTIVFAIRGDDHLCVCPYANEPEAVRQYCTAHEISLDHVTFRVERSEAVLPTLDGPPLDLVLVDGSHAFPHVFIDYFYAARLLRVGGSLIIDDVHLWTGKVLRDFLVSEPEWEAVEDWDGRTVAFRKVAALTERDWFDQPYVMSRSTPWRTRARMSASMIRRGDFRTLERYVRDTLPGSSRRQ